MQRVAPPTDEEARALVAGARWYHAFELRPGLSTPGPTAISPRDTLDALGVPADLSGKTALDIGAWDGPLTFELAHRGAAASALDIQDPDRTGFNTANHILGADVGYVRGSVYDLPVGPLRDLDLVLFKGVLYHLKHPLLALERINAAMKPGGTLHFATEMLVHYAEAADGRPVDRDAIVAFDALDVPACLAYPNRYRDGSNWFIPNEACLRGWLQVCGFEVVELKRYTPGTEQRGYGWCRKVSDTLAIEHPLY